MPKIKKYPELICGNDEIIIKLKACGICGTDIGNIFENSSKPTKKIGHEISGIISKIGKNVKNWKVDDKVVVNHHCPCEQCHFCLHGNETMCEKFTEEIEPCGLAENFKVSSWIIKKGGIFKIPKNMSFNEATLIEPLACCLRAWNKMENIKSDSVIIFGFGTIGIFHSIIANFKKIKTIIVDDDEFRKDFGKKENFGNRFVNVNDATPEKIEGVDLCIIANPDLSCLNTAINIVKKGGTILFFGEPRSNSTIRVDLSTIYSKEIKIITSYSASNNDFIKSMEFISKNKINLNKFITHDIKFEDAEKAINIAREGKNRIKVIVSTDY
ncbi:alcohol dehydrogenase catalytic domain-containing protein [Candidatus Nitrosopumilus sp. bin_6a]